MLKCVIEKCLELVSSYLFSALFTLETTQQSIRFTFKLRKYFHEQATIYWLVHI